MNQPHSRGKVNPERLLQQPLHLYNKSAPSSKLMVKDKSRHHQPAEPLQLYLVRIPFVGLGAFISLYLLSTLFYPGGSQVDKHSLGFSWLHNYWCNLLNPESVNGQPNPARPVALLAMLVLSVSLAIFWYLLPNLFAFKTIVTKLIQATGILSMLLAFLIFTPYHDLVINLAGLLGLIALFYTFKGLYQHHYKRLFWLGCSCFLLIGINNYIYYTHDYLFYLPLLQKITFACFLGWVGLLNWEVYKKQKLYSVDKAT